MHYINVSSQQRVLNDEDEVLSPSYDLAPSPPPAPSRVSKLDRRHTGRLRKRDNLLTEEGRKGGGGGAKSYEKGGGGGAKSYDVEKAWL